jgi:hypothetical protein
MSTFVRSKSLAFILALITPLAAAAQASRSDSAQRYSLAKQLKAVTVTTARAVGVVGGASAVIVKPSEVRSSAAPLLEQALRESPFVHVRQNSRGEMELSVRGSDSRQAETDLAIERNFFLSSGVLRSLRALVSLDNVANATVFDQCGLPQPGRTLRVMVTLR